MFFFKYQCSQKINVNGENDWPMDMREKEDLFQWLR